MTAAPAGLGRSAWAAAILLAAVLGGCLAMRALPHGDDGLFTIDMATGERWACPDNRCQLND